VTLTGGGDDVFEVRRLVWPVHGTAPTCLVTITDALAHEVTAAFDGPRELALTVSGVNGGTGSVSFGIDPGPYDTCNNLTTNRRSVWVRTVGRRW